MLFDLLVDGFGLMKNLCETLEESLEFAVRLSLNTSEGAEEQLFM